ncbi:MAG: protoglobin domain-containing protein [Bacteroidetes bacterium]|nr:protoglobin domain-containing protein [Rhodothermia bacterium]MCS7156019.1 protoglobin domain-containing protein [Bacteroidota bacterium]MCX7907707.1 protoglobin domain-containing protein [Bacteroidota bacterium]MDW8137836.1 protoglobin domain-containing protein [Bacteroidota bacterium]MDW8286313.1 protoglobin domain-containing protein [Bacteroidota bacterium]
MELEAIPGYTYGTAEVARSPLTDEEFAQLKAALLWSEEDVRYLHLAGEVLRDQVEAVLDVWYGFVGSHPHLLYYFVGLDGKPIEAYLERVRKRFGRWILDTCFRPYDRAWLDYQQEIGLRHHRSKKNQTDGVEAPAYVPLRYLIAFIAPIALTIKPFLAKRGHGPEEVEKMHAAWLKAVVLQVALWSRPYAREEDY